MPFAFSPFGLIAAALVVAILAFGLYKRIGVIGSFQRAELTRGARFAKARVTTAGASVLLLAVIGVAAVAGASVRAVYALLFLEAVCVLVYLLLTVRLDSLRAGVGAIKTTNGDAGMARPNMRLKLPRGDRSKGSGVL